MYPTLIHIPNQVPGLAWPVFGFGLLLALWAVATVAIVGVLAWRQGFNADTMSYVGLLGVVGAAIAWILPSMLEPEGLPIRSYGVMMLLGVIAGTSLAVRRARRRGISADTIYSLVFWLVIPGVIGARAFYVIEYWRDFVRPTFGATLKEILNVPGGGLVVYGSLFGGLAGLAGFSRTYRISVLALADILAPCFLLGLGMGRVGCLMYGCCFGGVCHAPWAISFPWASPAHVQQVINGQTSVHGLKFRGKPTDPPVIAEVEAGTPAAAAGLTAGQRVASINAVPVYSVEECQRRLLVMHHDGESIALVTDDGQPVHQWKVSGELPHSLPVQPAQLFGAINGFLICLVLIAYTPFARRDGELLALGLTIYPITRFLLEIIRTDESAIFGTGLSISQNVSLLVLPAAIALWWYVLRQPAGLTHQQTPRQPA